MAPTSKNAIVPLVRAPLIREITFRDPRCHHGVKVLEVEPYGVYQPYTPLTPTFHEEPQGRWWWAGTREDVCSPAHIRGEEVVAGVAELH